MKHNVSIALLTAAALIACLSHARADEKRANLLVNGGFESGAGDSRPPEGWEKFWARDAGAGSAAVDEAVSHSGRCSLHVEHHGEHDWAVNAAKPVPVTAGDILELSGWVKAEKLSEARLCAITGDAAGNVMDWSFASSETAGTHDWRELSRRFIVPAGCASVQYRFIGNGPGVAWLDDASLTREGNAAAIQAALKDKQLVISNALLSARLDAAAGTLAVTDKRTNHAWEQKPLAASGVVTDVAVKGNALALKFWDIADDIRLEVTFALAPDRAEIQASIEGKGTLSQPLAFPQPFVSGAGSWLVVPMNEGITFPVDDATVQPIELVGYSGHGLCMPWYGITDAAGNKGSGGAGVMTILQTPDDADVEITRQRGTGLFIQPRWEATRGQFGYARKLTWVFLDTGGYPAQAKRYRDYARSTGLLKTLAEKQQANPNVDLLLGAANVWNWDMDKVSLCREMKSLGMDHVLWSAGGKPAEIEAINAMGYLSSRYDIFQDVWPPGKPAWAVHEGWPQDLVLLPDGSPMKGWAHVQKNADGSETIFDGGVISSPRQVERARKTIAEDLKTHAYRCRFIDTTTASPFREDYNPDHPLSRSDDRRYKMQLLEVCAKEDHLVVGSETGIDPAVPYVSYFEGMMSLGPYRLPDAGRDMLQYKPPTPDFLKYQVGQAYRVPLWELVYHDCVVADWYWGDYNNKVPEVWDRRDLFNILYGTPPMVMFDKATWAKDKERFVKSYKDICPLVRQVAHEQLLSHEFVTSDHAVQRTTWSDGTTIVVNFGTEAHALEDGKTVGAMGFMVNRSK